MRKLAELIWTSFTVSHLLFTTTGSIQSIQSDLQSTIIPENLDAPVFNSQNTRCVNYTRRIVESNENLKSNSARELNKIIQHTGIPTLTEISVGWVPISSDHLDSFCGFAVYWYATSTVGRSDRHLHPWIELQPNVTEHVIQGLQPGTNYDIYVVAFFDNSQYSQSYYLRTFTKGVGPDKPCKCNVQGTKNETFAENICEVCACKNNDTIGEKCDKCRDSFYYMSADKGCIICSDCLNTPASNGSCSASYVPGSAWNEGRNYMCYLRPGYKGLQECANGFFRSESSDGFWQCVPCSCNDNEDRRLSPICEDHTGVCNKCLYNTAGPRCEKCADGYKGDALQRSCIEQSRAAKIAGILISMLIITIVIVVFAVFIYRRYCHYNNHQGFWSVQLKDDRENVNFTTLMEEPDTDSFNFGKLEKV